MRGQFCNASDAARGTSLSRLCQSSQRGGLQRQGQEERQESGGAQREGGARVAADGCRKGSVKRDLLQETYYIVKRDLLQCQKRPTTVSKETYYGVKRDLLQCQKRPTKVSKET